MKYLWMFVVFGVILAGYLGVFMISTAPHDPDVWHLDPLTIPTSETPNSYRMAPEGMTTERIDRVSPIFSENALTIAQAFDEFALRQRATVRIAGFPAEQMMTYVQRTESLKFPDYITIKFINLGENQSTIAVYSRSRYGYADQGVNKARVDRWVKTLETFEQTN